MSEVCGTCNYLRGITMSEPTSRPSLKDTKLMYAAIDKALANHPVYEHLKEKTDPLCHGDLMWLIRDLFLEGYILGSREEMEYNSALEQRRLDQLKKRGTQ
mgnify:CR=1 FL=1